MKAIHGSSLEDPDLLQQLVTQVKKKKSYALCFKLFLQELKSRGIVLRLETPKPSKKSFVPFSTPRFDLYKLMYFDVITLL